MTPPSEVPPETRKRLALAEWRMANARARQAADAIGRSTEDDRLSISSSYYTMLHCARAAAVIETGMIPRSHNGAKNVFGRLCKETGEFPDRLGRELHLGLDMRMAADYTPEAELTTNEAHHKTRAGAEFLQHTRRFLLRRGCTEHELGDGPPTPKPGGKPGGGPGDTGGGAGGPKPTEPNDEQHIDRGALSAAVAAPSALGRRQSRDRKRSSPW